MFFHMKFSDPVKMIDSYIVDVKYNISLHLYKPGQKHTQRKLKRKK